MRIDILTLFPSMFAEPLNTSILGRAQADRKLKLGIWNIRDYSLNKHRVVDDTPYGGGAGMVLKPDVVVACIEHVKTVNSGPVIYMSPQGESFSQTKAKALADLAEFIILCGHYEGLDERVLEHWVDQEISIGDYVLTGGEIPAMVIVDAVSRMIPGVLGHAESAQTDSFYQGLLEHPHYTRPADFRDLQVPMVLMSGHHDNIRRWRLKESLRRTLIRRPDLLQERQLTKEENDLLAELHRDKDSERR